jgi:hypothetical protein
LTTVLITNTMFDLSWIGRMTTNASRERMTMEWRYEQSFLYSASGYTRVMAAASPSVCAFEQGRRLNDSIQSNVARVGVYAITDQVSFESPQCTSGDARKLE